MSLNINENDLLGNAELVEAFTPEQEAAVQEKLLLLLKRRAALYTGGDSSSVRLETAQELMQSIVFCLDLYFRRSGQSKSLLLSEDEEELFSKAQKLCEREIECGRALFSKAVLTAADFGNISYTDTLTGIGSFFRRYDYRFLSHQTPCDIDYQLCHAVSDGVLGVEYINEYLRRLIIENSFVGCFKKELVEQLLQNFSSDYRELLINIFEPVCANAVGLSLLGKSCHSLCIEAQDLDKLRVIFEPLSATPAKKALSDAAERVCSELRITDSHSLGYVRKMAEELYPRIEASLPFGGLSGVFVLF